MNTEQVAQTQTLDAWCRQFNWQGGTIHHVHQEIKSRLNKKGFAENASKQWCMFNVEVDFVKF
jgi:hypothetical protein